MQIDVLGPLMVVDDDGAVVPLRSARQRILILLLTAAHGRTLQADEIVEALWPDALPEDPNGALQSQISRLRRQLGTASAQIETVGTGYRLVSTPDQIDAQRFERFLADAQRLADEPAVALDWIDRALDLWRGRAYQDHADHPALAPEAIRVEELRADAVELRAECLLELGRFTESATAMQRHTRDYPFRERPVALLLRALAADGRHADALDEFERFRRVLDEELGLEPSPELRAVEQSILQHEDSSRLVPALGVPGNSFVGREAEVGKTIAMLERSRLVTVTGPGGVGKTRLALHVGRDVAAAYDDGVYLCELARVLDTGAVVSAVASALHVEERIGRSLTDRIIEFLQTKHALLVIDNCEHVLGPVAELVTAILVRAPRVTVLATSRERLGTEGEQLVTLGPLSTPAWDDPEAPSVILFTDRARAVRPELTLGEDDFRTVCELCLRLDGLPLAIELAAAQSVSMTPVEILAGISDRLTALADRRRAVPRHRSLDGVFGWSYDLLGPAERSVFEQVSVFTGGWTSDAAATVAEASQRDLSALVEHSLVQARDHGGRMRFTMLEPVRQYADARLRASGLQDETRARHAAWSVAFAEAADAGMTGADEVDWRRRLDGELANLRAAHRWCLEHDPEASIRFAGSLYRLIWSGAESEVFVWADEAVSRFGDIPHPRLPFAYAAAALGRALAGDLAKARSLAEAGIAKAGEDVTAARFAWEVLADVENFSGGFEGALPYYDRAIELGLLAGDDHQVAISRLTRAMSLAYIGRSGDAIDACDDVAPLIASLRNPGLIAFSDYTNGEVRVDSAPTEALPFLRRSVALARRIGSRLTAGLAGLTAASCEARVGDPASALAEYAELIDHWDRSGAWNMQWATLRTLIEVLARLRRDAEATTLYGAMLASATAPPVAGTDAHRIGETVSALRARLGDERFEALRQEGAVLSDNEAVAFALACVRS